MRLFLLSLYLFPCLTATAQVQFSSLSFEKACRQAARSQKVVMVVVESAKCKQCNEVAQRGLNHPEAFAVNAMAVPLLIHAGDPQKEKLFSSYFTSDDGFGLLYFTGEGHLIHRWNRASTSGQEYVAQTTIAYKKREQPAPDISRLEKTVQQDPTNTEAVLQLYQARRDLGIPVEQMANEFARAATIPVWLDSAIVIGTLFKLQPVLGTYADSVMRHADKTLFNKLWYKLPLAERVETNRVIISRTGAKAAAEKNTKLALRNASFAAGVMDNAPTLERTQTFNSIMAAYFRNVKDTLTYLKSIEGLMTNYYMLLDADSVKRADSAARLLAFNKLLPIGAVDTVFTPRPVESPASFVPRAQFFAGAINTYCWDIYKMKPNSPWAQKATGWAAHGLRIYESAELYDTYARLLYTNGRKEEAIAAQVKAIAAAQQIQKTSVPNFEKVLNAMKANEPIIDLE